MLISQLSCKDCLDMLDLRKEDLKRIGREPGLLQALSFQTNFFRLRQSSNTGTTGTSGKNGSTASPASSERRSKCSDDEPDRRRSIRVRRNP